MLFSTMKLQVDLEDPHNIAQIVQGAGFIALAMWLIFANNSKVIWVAAELQAFNEGFEWGKKETRNKQRFRGHFRVCFRKLQYI